MKGKLLAAENGDRMEFLKKNMKLFILLRKDKFFLIDVI